MEANGSQRVSQNLTNWTAYHARLKYRERDELQWLQLTCAMRTLTIFAPCVAASTPATAHSWLSLGPFDIAGGRRKATLSIFGYVAGHLDDMHESRLLFVRGPFCSGCTNPFGTLTPEAFHCRRVHEDLVLCPNTSSCEADIESSQPDLCGVYTIYARFGTCKTSSCDHRQASSTSRPYQHSTWGRPPAALASA